MRNLSCINRESPDLVSEVNSIRSLSLSKPLYTTVRLAGFPSDLTVASWKNCMACIVCQATIENMLKCTSDPRCDWQAFHLT